MPDRNPKRLPVDLDLLDRDVSRHYNRQAGLGRSAGRVSGAWLVRQKLGPWRWYNNGVALAAKRDRCTYLFARSCVQPIAPIEPPTSFASLGRSQKSVWPGLIDRPNHS